jgi:hypothetical protein
LVWKADYGKSGGLADGNKDGTVNAADYTIWRNNLGSSAHALGQGSTNGNSSAPEPSAFLLVAQLVIVLSSFRLCISRPRGV